MFAASAYDGVVSPDYCVFELAVPSETKFFEYLFKTPVLVLQFALRSKGIGSGFNRLYSDSFGAVPVPVPPVHEQTAIVRLLSYMDRRIRQYIRAKERLIGLLGEQKQATIHQAVTGKIDVRTSQPYPTYTDSGVEWLGQVPEHWNLVPLKWIARRYRTGLTPPTSDSKYYEDGGVPWYGPSSCGIREEVDTPVRCLAEVAFTNGAARFVTGPALLVVVIGATVGRMAIMLDNGSTNQQIVTFPLSCASVIPRFLVRQLRGSGPWLKANASTATIPIVDTSVVAGVRCAIPPFEEQIVINEALEPLLVNTSRLIQGHRREIRLLAEYRARLIADVVTGRIDVRKAAAELPEVVPMDCGDGLGNTLTTDDSADLEDLDTHPGEAPA